MRLDFACLWRAVALDSNVATCAFRLDFVVGFVCRSVCDFGRDDICLNTPVQTLSLLRCFGVAECGDFVDSFSPNPEGGLDWSLVCSAPFAFRLCGCVPPCRNGEDPFPS
eukprot:g32866.t1